MTAINQSISLFRNIKADHYKPVCMY